MSPTGGEPSLWLGLIPKPLAVVLAVILALAYVISEVTGKLNGPLSKLLERRKAKQETQTVGWRERDRRVEELEQTVEILKGQIELLRDQASGHQDELRMVHRLSDHQRRAIRMHTDWDNEWVPRARLLGLDIPDPPDLYVYLEEEGVRHG